VENSFGEVGLCPGNHLDPSADFCGKALFEIERLLSYKVCIIISIVASLSNELSSYRFSEPILKIVALNKF